MSSTAGSTSLIEEMANVLGPTLLKRSLGLQADRYSQYIGPTTDFEPSLINLSSFDPQDESLLARGTLRKVSDDAIFLMLPDFNTPGNDHVTDDADEIESIVAPHGRTLIDIYFRVVHPYFPIIQKTVFYEKYDRSYREFSPPLLAAIYILAINWWDHSEELAHLPRPNVRELERLVRATLADAMYRPKLSTVQAGLLLSQRPEGEPVGSHGTARRHRPGIGAPPGLHQLEDTALGEGAAQASRVGYVHAGQMGSPGSRAAVAHIRPQLGRAYVGGQ